MRINCSSTSDGPDPGSNWAILSALRFFLAMVVVLGHCCWYVGGYSDWTYVGLWLNQGSAVYGFFILSGYSIAASLEGNSAGFYRRRFIRIWPLYLTCIAFGLVVAMRIPQGLIWPTGEGRLHSTSLASIFASLLMLQTVVAGAIPIVGQIWSLSPEWWLYMVGPRLRKLSNFALLGLVAISFLAFMNIPTPRGSGPEGFEHGLALLTLSWLWLTGFVYRRFERTPLGAAILILPSGFALFFAHFTGAPLFISIFTLLLIGEFKVRERHRRFCNLLGDLSYPLYLFHIPIIVLLLTVGVTATAPMVIASFAVSLAVLYGIDYPCRNYYNTRRTAARQPVRAAPVPQVAIEVCEFVAPRAK
jgi:peptidoglycan/LPS O-acetylase OafA/YrhL